MNLLILKIKLINLNIICLRNIEYIGDNNLMYTIDNQKKENIQLGLYKNIDF